MIYENTVAIPKVGAGSTITTGQLVFSLSNPERLKFAAEIDEDDIDRISSESMATIKLEVQDKIFEGKVSNIDQKITATESGAEVFLARLVINKPEKNLRIGMKGEATFILESKNNILRVPIEAVFDEEEKSIVYVNDNGEAKKVEITLGLENNEYYEIKSGLKEGNEVIVGSNTKELKNGSKIRIKQ